MKTKPKAQGFVIHRPTDAESAWELVRDLPSFEIRSLAAMIMLASGMKPSTIADICQLNIVAMDAIAKHVAAVPRKGGGR